jgi:hypothetical protein
MDNEPQLEVLEVQDVRREYGFYRLVTTKPFYANWRPENRYLCGMVFIVSDILKPAFAVYVGRASGLKMNPAEIARWQPPSDMFDSFLERAEKRFERRTAKTLKLFEKRERV